MLERRLEIIVRHAFREIYCAEWMHMGGILKT
jgi:hypothetical protein